MDLSLTSSQDAGLLNKATFLSYQHLSLRSGLLSGGTAKPEFNNKTILHPPPDKAQISMVVDECVLLPPNSGCGQMNQGLPVYWGKLQSMNGRAEGPSDLLPLHLMVENRSLQNSSDSRLQLVFLDNFFRMYTCLSTFSSLKGFLHSFLLAPLGDLLRRW